MDITNMNVFAKHIQKQPHNRKIEIVHQILALGAKRCGESSNLSEQMGALREEELEALAAIVRMNWARAKATDEFCEVVTGFLLSNPVMPSSPRKSLAA